MTIQSNEPATSDRKPWIVRAIGPRPAPTRALRLREVLRRTLWIIPLEIGIAMLLRLVGVPSGTALTEDIESMMRANPVFLFLTATLLGPTFEELVFRWVPSRLSDLVLRSKQGSRWALGIPVALAFAFVHSLQHGADGTSVELVFGFHLDTSGIPSSQFVFGLLLWDFMRRYGFWACLLSHAFHNAILMSLGLLALETLP